ncbi:MAG: hypothetical protein ACYDHX_07950 [Methanothrix sp.]
MNDIAAVADNHFGVVTLANSPKLLKELHEILGPLHGFEQVSAKCLAVQIGSRNVFLPLSFQIRLEELRGQWIAVTLIDGRYYLRLLKGESGSP